MKKIVFGLVVLSACTSRQSETDRAAYVAEIDTWHQKRVERLKGPAGWLNVSGLYWLNEGINTFGSGEGNVVRFPKGKIDEFAGVFMVSQGTVVMDVAANVSITSDGERVRNKTIYHPDSSKTPVLESGSLKWFVIKRESKLGIRLRDLENPSIANFKGIARYPVDMKWRIEARVEKADSSKTIEVTNIIGQTFQQHSQGTLVFSIDGKEYRLDALDEGEEDWFIIFSDPTNAKETYGAGRYLYVKPPDPTGVTIIDFNKAYNPPCAFTEFATCSLPPRQNRIDVDVTAGEKNYENH